MLSGIWVYPIKSAGGIPVRAWEADERGLKHDRRWMLVDGSGRFLSQRTIPRMALIKPRITSDALVVEAPGASLLELPLEPEGGERVLASVWRDTVEVLPAGRDADRWFGGFLGFPCRLVHLPEDSVRRVDPDYGRPGDRVSLADGYPFLLISEGSLAGLNGRLENPVPMDRFRPNLVVRGCGPFAEDGWRRIRIGSMGFRVVKPCSRCTVPTVDQSTAEAGKEPLRTLARFRKVGGKVLFGQNLIHDAPGRLSVGDRLEVLEGA